MSILIDPNAEVSIQFWACVDGSNVSVWASEDEAKNGAANKAITHVSATFREPNFRDASELADLAMVMNLDGSLSIGFNAVKMERVCKLLKSWNIKAADGKVLDCNRENVYRLHPTIAFYLATLLERELGIDQVPEA